jgi:hypothetical protein
MNKDLLAGEWDCLTATPMGEQKSVLRFQVEGDRFTGTNTADIGALDIAAGRIDGDEIHWEMQLTKPMRMLLLCTAQIDEDRLEGLVRAGGFGEFPISATRRRV